MALTNLKHNFSKLWVFMMLFGITFGTCQDATSSSMYASFPATSKSFIRLRTTLATDLLEFTVCVRLRPTSMNVEFSNFFSYATPTSIGGNDVDFYFNSKGKLQIMVNNMAQSPESAIIQVHKWQHVCAMWSSATGQFKTVVNGTVVQLGTVASNSVVLKGGVLILGQDQDVMGGGFQPEQAFLGDLTDLQMWDHLIPIETIKCMSQCKKSVRGNVITWDEIKMNLNDVDVAVSETNLFCEE